MHLGKIAIVDLTLVVRLRGMRPKRGQTGQPYAGEKQEKSQAKPQQSPLCPVARNDPPLRREKPYAVRKVPRSRDQAHDVEEKQRGLKHFVLYLAKGEIGPQMQVRPEKAHRVHMPKDVDECDPTGLPLQGIHPIA